MSCVFIVTPIVVANWSAISAVVSATAAHMGYNMIRQASEGKKESMQQVELELKNSEVMTEQLRRGESMTLAKGNVKITLTLDAHGRLKASVSGPENIVKENLRREGQKFLDHVTQQYAYQSVMNELKNKGFSLVDESVDDDGRIRLKIRKYE